MKIYAVLELDGPDSEIVHSIHKTLSEAMAAWAQFENNGISTYLGEADIASWTTPLQLELKSNT